MKIKYAVTGATGFVAKHLIARLINEGIEVTAVSRSGTGRTDLKDFALDYQDLDALQKAFCKIDIVVHLASRAHHINESVSTKDINDRYYKANVMSTTMVAHAAQMAGVKRVVFISSVGVNGSQTDGVAFTINSAPIPSEPYSKSKWIAERKLSEVLKNGATDYVILRPPLVYGPQCPGNFQRLLNITYKLPFLPFGSLNAPRTFIGVHNLVDGIMVAAANNGLSRKTFLIADDCDFTVGQIINILAKGLGKSSWQVFNFPPFLLGFFASLVGRANTWRKLSAPLQVDGKDFMRATGWKPPINPEVGLIETAKSFLANQNIINKI